MLGRSWDRTFNAAASPAPTVIPAVNAARATIRFEGAFQNLTSPVL
jgi:hypothetical protein